MPTPAKELHKELRYGNVNAHRYFDCPHYQKCLEEAVKKYWVSFSCRNCQNSRNIRNCRVAPSHASHLPQALKLDRPGPIHAAKQNQVGLYCRTAAAVVKNTVSSLHHKLIYVWLAAHISVIAWCRIIAIPDN